MYYRLLSILFAAILLLAAGPGPAAAAPPAAIQAANDEATIEFPDRITFQVDLQGDAEIDRVVLEYGVAQLTCGEVVAQAVPEITPAREVHAAWTWEMRQSGSQPPGARIWWRWRAHDTAGREYLTEQQTLTWLDDYLDWQTASGGSINLHWYEGDKSFGKELHSSAVESLADLEASTGLQPDVPIDIYIYGSSDDLRAAILYEPGWTGGLAYAEHGIVIIGIAPDDIAWGKTTIAHELTHVLVGRLTFTCMGEVPTWLHEGLAMYGEGGLDDAAEARFAQAVADNTLLSVRAMSGAFSENPDRADISYSQSYSLVQFLLDRYGTAKMLELLDAVHNGLTIEEALLAVYGLTLESFEDAWRTAIGAAPREGQGQAPTATPAPTAVPTYAPISGELAVPTAGPTRVLPTPQPTTVPAATPTPTPAAGPAGLHLPTWVIAVAGGAAALIVLFFVVAIAVALRRRNRLPPTMLLLLLLLMLLGNACGPAPTSSPTPVLIVPSPTPAEGAPTPAAYGPRPTVTPYLPPTAAPGTFADPEVGVTLRLPAGWTTEPGEDESTISWFYAPDDAALAVLFYDLMPDDQTLAEATADITQYAVEGLADIATLSDQGLTLDDGREAWQTVVEGDREDGLRLKVGLTTAVQGGRIFVLMAFSSVEGYDGERDAIDQLARGMQLTTPSYYGIPRSEALVLAGGESTNPRDYDPATTHGSGDKMVYSALVSFDPELNLLPELAASWEVAGGTVYTFTLRANARFHNGRPVTAQDVVYSWERAADPDTASDTVLTYLGDIVGVKEMNAGNADHIAGLTAVDDHTLRVTIDAPKPYFLLKLTYPTAFVVDRDNVESGDDWYTRPNGTGPYRLTRWEPMNLRLYERNDDYYLDPPAIRYVIVKVYQGVAIRLYESGEIDVAAVGSYNVPRVLDPNDPLHPDVRSAVNLCTGYITLDTAQAPFDDLKVRQAFTMAFDRQQYIDVVYHGIGLPAVGVFPPGLPGYNGDLQGLPYDPERARQLLAESSYGGPQGLPPIVFTNGGYGSDVSADVAALVQMWQQTLGVTITVENLEPDRYLDEVYAGRHGQIFTSGWCADYPDPENLADILFHSGSQQNRGNYSNPQVDALLEQARVEQDVGTRIRLYQQVEQIIVDDAPVIFTLHSISYLLVKPYLQGYVLTPIDVPLERYLWIDESKMK